jgi:hypothetical protein
MNHLFLVAHIRHTRTATEGRQYDQDAVLPVGQNGSDTSSGFMVDTSVCILVRLRRLNCPRCPSNARTDELTNRGLPNLDMICGCPGQREDL